MVVSAQNVITVTMTCCKRKQENKGAAWKNSCGL